MRAEVENHLSGCNSKQSSMNDYVADFICGVCDTGEIKLRLSISFSKREKKQYLFVKKVFTRYDNKETEYK